MNKYVKTLVEGYKKYIGIDLKVQKNPGYLCTTISKSDSEEKYNINMYRSFVGPLMWYTTKVGPDVVNTKRALEVRLSHLGTEHWKTLGRLIWCLKGKYTKCIIIRNPKVMKVVMFCYSKYATDKDTRKSVSGLVATLGGTLLMCLSQTYTNVTLIGTEAEYVLLSAC